MDSRKILIIGANGQLGRALQAKYTDAQSVDLDKLDISNREAVTHYRWNDVEIVMNAAAYTNVDGAETPEGRVVAWQANAVAVANLVEASRLHDFTLVHISTDYVFDGTQNPHTEDEPFSPLSNYGASKAAGDVVLRLAPKHYLLRTSWVIGDGKNFVRTMLELAEKGVNPTVVSDQVGRPTFTAELVRAIDHLLNKPAAYGTYNVSNEGDEVSWADFTREIYQLVGLKNTVSDTTTAAYYKDKPEAATRPLHSSFDMSKLAATGFTNTDWRDDLKAYLERQRNS